MSNMNEQQIWDEVFIRMVVQGIGHNDVVGTIGNTVTTTNDRLRELTYISAALVADEAVEFRRSHRS